MKTIEYWRNFNMNSELHISGSFIYSGLNQLDKMVSFQNEDEVFEVIYNLSVGFERLMKIAIVLIEYNDYKNQNEFEKSLITHNHLDLIARIQKKHKFNLSSNHNLFLECLTLFYKKYRYDRYCLSSVMNLEKEFVIFKKFLKKGIDIKFNKEHGFMGYLEMPRIRKYIGKISGKIASQTYELIRETASLLNLYTYEIRRDSKAFKIFMAKKYDFFEEDLVAKELLLYLLKAENKGQINIFLDNLDPIDFELCDVIDALDAFRSDLKLNELIETVETIYAEMDGISDRIEQLKYFNSNLNHMFIEDNEE